MITVVLISDCTIDLVLESCNSLFKNLCFSLNSDLNEAAV